MAETFAARERPIPRVSVVIVCHNSGPLLRHAIDSVLEQSLDGDLELILVDNASGDGQLDELPADSRLRLLLNPDNRGFGAACNQAAAIARGRFMLLLNPDCQLPSDALSRLLSLREVEGVDVLGARLLNADGSLQAASYRRDPRPLRAIRQAISGSAADIALDTRGDVTDVEAISGALMLMETSRFRELGGFDEGFRLHVEDLDLCRRAREAGLRVAVANRVEVTHAKGASSKARPVWVEWQKHRGMWRYFRKHDAAATPLLLRPLLWLGMWAHFALAAPLAWWRAR